jgi:hypothetical protein
MFRVLCVLSFIQKLVRQDSYATQRVVTVSEQLVLIA